MILLIGIPIIACIIVAFFWALYYSVKKSGREQERLENIEENNENVEESRKKTLKYRLDSVDTATDWLRKHTGD